MNSFMSWVGGKKALRDEIVLRFPPTYSRYIEVFGGGGWVLFHKSPGKEMEVYNDFNPNLANLFRCVRDHPNELCDELRYTLNSRLDFDYVREMLHTKTELPDIRRAAYFYQIIRESYASGLDSFGAQPHSMWNNFPLIHDACGRLQKVVIENKDFEKLIKQYDRPEAFFYCDPPYYNTENYYCEMAEYSVLTPFLGSPDLEEINVNGWDDIALTYLDGSIVKLKDHFHSPQHAVDIIKRLLHHSGMIIDNATPTAQGHLPGNTRITALKDPSWTRIAVCRFPFDSCTRPASHEKTSLKRDLRRRRWWTSSVCAFVTVSRSLSPEPQARVKQLC